MNILTTNSLYAGYGNKKILNDINLCISAGQFISIIAPNGTGKSTLLKTIAGLLPPLKGKIKLNERVLTDYKRRELAKYIAVVDTNVTIFDYTIEQMVFMGRFAHIPRFAAPSSMDHFIVQETLKDLNIWHKRSCRCSQVSQGEMQKIIIARALVQQPKLLLLDEPTAHLDISNQYSILNLIKDLTRKKNMTVVAILHDINLAIQFSTHLIFLKNGNLIDYGISDDVLNPAVLKKLYDMDFVLHRDKTSTYVRPIATPKYYN